MRNPLLKVVPWIGLVSFALVTLVVMYTRQPAPAGEALPATSNTPPAAEPAPPTAASAPPPAAEPSAALSRKTAPTSYGPSKDAKSAPLTAEQLTERAKTQLALDPSAALSDIEQADKLAGPQDETRRVLEIHALVRLGKVGMARSLTDRFYRNFPNSDRAIELERLTGYHPRPGHP
jgi:hypothetical protein